MIINDKYDLVLDRLLKVADQTQVFNGRNHMKTSKEIEMMTLAFWSIIFKSSLNSTISVASLKKMVKSFEDYLNSNLHVRLMSRLNNHLMIEWRRDFYNRLFMRPNTDKELLDFFIECLSYIEKEQCFLVDYHPSSLIEYEYKSEIEDEASNFIDELNDAIK